MTPIEAFNKYVAIKKHFKDKEFDLTKVELGTIPVARAIFEKHKTRAFFEKLSREYKDTELIEYIVANMVDDQGHLFNNFGKRIYRDYKSRINNLDYLFESQLQDIQLQSEKLKIQPFDCSRGYSVIMRMFLGQKVCPETLIILNRFANFKDEHDEVFKDDYLWEDISLLMVKYRPFVRVAHKLERYKEVYSSTLGDQVV
jgi:hypothetical protein